jgi:REP element-mobilizing transposase RayT
MTAPRQVLPGTTYLVTRRCLRRACYLRPDAITNAIIRYLLAVGARRHHIQLHAFTVMSNHYHLVLTDPEARLPAFMRFLDSLIARAVNATHGHWETIWSSEQFNAVALQGPDDVVDRIAYTLANPVEAGLVRHGRLWPGLWSAPERMGVEPEEVPRPGKFFSPKGSMPRTAKLRLHLPPGFTSVAGFQARVEAALAEREARAARTRKRFLGVAKVLAQKWGLIPESWEPRRQLKPRVASLDRGSRIDALERLVEFLQRYRAAWEARRRGVADVVFPAGTYQLRLEHGVLCAGAS